MCERVSIGLIFNDEVSSSKVDELLLGSVRLRHVMLLSLSYRIVK